MDGVLATENKIKSHFETAYTIDGYNLFNNIAVYVISYITGE